MTGAGAAAGAAPGMITVIGLGPAGPELLTADARRAIESVGRRLLRTSRHPAAVAVEPAETCDDLYESGDSLDRVYTAIVDRILELSSDGDILYAVPGSPRVAEATVSLLEQRAGDREVRVRILPSLSFLDLAWDRLAVDPIELGVRLVDGHRFSIEVAGQRGPFLVGQCESRQVLSDIKLSIPDGAEPLDDAVLLHHLGLPDEAVTRVSWVDLDRAIEPDHLTSLWIPALSPPVGSELVAFEELVRTLRVSCPWDREQTHQSLTRHLLEEAHEVLEAIDHLGPADGHDIPHGYEHLRDELGDLLFQVFFHAAIAAEIGGFTIADVARAIHDKLVRRHPHVFAGVAASSSAAVSRRWDQIKADERRSAGHLPGSALDGIPVELPALARAQKLQQRAAGVGFDWAGIDGVWAKLGEEVSELTADPSEHELGDVLFSAVNLARWLGVDAETAVRRANTRFTERFARVEVLATARGIDLSAAGIDVLDALWDEAKAGLAADTT